MGRAADTRRRINHFHTLIKECSKLAAAKQSLLSEPGARPEDAKGIDEKIERVSKEMAEMGGLDWYQKASLLGQSKKRGGDTSRWLVGKLRELGLSKLDGGRLRLLDVGALSSLNYAKEAAWISVTPIDLNSQEPGIYQQDFLDIDPSRTTRESEDALGGADSDEDAEEKTRDISHLFSMPFDVICLSLVVNFIGDPAKRGDMLKQATRLLKPSGLLYLVLPLSCVNNSRYLDDGRLKEIAEYLGFEQLYMHHTAKLAHYVYRFASGRPVPGTTNEGSAATKYKKTMLHSAPGRNNFSIVV
ncbi:hypothetical protein GQ54DRAFT_324855 [Martensiomyces pterosporus]|nr:hypothetical protein GQ54DRAFT_324855 [Martensiomyces pterosporus]